MKGSSRHIIINVVLILILTVVVYFVISGFQLGDFAFRGFLARPYSASVEADQIETIFQAHFVVMAFLFAIIVVPLLYTVVVFVQEPGDETDAPHIHGNTTLEIAWTVVPVLLVIGFAIWGVALYTDIVEANRGEVVIRTQGYKWDWTFYYPEHNNKVDAALVLEAGTPIRLEMQSNDVIHAFWVPQFRVKQDVVPYNNALTAEIDGREQPLLGFGNPDYEQAAAEYRYAPQIVRFTPTTTGVYRVRCAEICGTQHWGMLANVFVLDSAQYQAWLDGELVLPADPVFSNGTIGSEGYYLDELQTFCAENGFTGEQCESSY